MPTCTGWASLTLPTVPDTLHSLTPQNTAFVTIHTPEHITTAYCTFGALEAVTHSLHGSNKPLSRRSLHTHQLTNTSKLSLVRALPTGELKNRQVELPGMLPNETCLTVQVNLQFHHTLTSG
ncbi:hypothetical protein E2C01_083359 [Portunus trituberculatus]|uniref:Uncharacterized protein n=1 Tax=Portunus trituberculatus TaxID=210409 RepID=A0A5B7J7L6_PORTR|nr:hypothetical protein [Portunus trituberculatus]